MIIENNWNSPEAVLRVSINSELKLPPNEIGVHGFEAMINKTETWTGNLFPETCFFFQTFQGVLASLNEQQVYLYLPWPARALIFWRLNPWRNSLLSQ